MATGKNICFFNSNKAWGGGEKWHLDFASRLFPEGYHVMIACHPKGSLLKKALNNKIPCSVFKISNISFINPFKIYSLYRFLKQQHTHLLILNLPSDLKAAGIAARFAGVKHIIYRRGSAIPVRNTWLNRFLFRHIITGVLANSLKTRDTILQNNESLIDPEKINVIYNGINLEEYDNKNTVKIYQPSARELIIGNAGRLVKQKGQLYLVDIAEKLKNTGIDFKILIAGEGELKEKIMAYAKQKHVNENIVFTGFVPNIKSFMHSLDIFVLPSLWEGFGYVLVEAMACKKPVIGFDVSSNPEIIRHNETGYLIENENIEQFTDKIIMLANDKQLRHTLGEKGRYCVEQNFTMKTALKQFKEIYVGLQYKKIF